MARLSQQLDGPIHFLAQMLADTLFYTRRAGIPKLETGVEHMPSPAKWRTSDRTPSSIPREMTYLRISSVSTYTISFLMCVDLLVGCFLT